MSTGVGASAALLRTFAWMADTLPEGKHTSGVVETIATGAGLRTMNGLHPGPDATESDILRAADSFEYRGRWSIMCVESATTDSVRSAATVFDAVIETTTTYVRPLTAEVVGTTGSDVDIRPVASRERAAEFESVVSGAFDAGRSLGAPFVDEAVLADDGARAVVAYRHGVPVATGMSVLDDFGFLGIFAIAVLPEVRRQGLGAAVTARLLDDGRRAGAHTASLQSSAAGRSVYRRLGFAPATDGITYCFPSEECERRRSATT